MLCAGTGSTQRPRLQIGYCCRRSIAHFPELQLLMPKKPHSLPKRLKRRDERQAWPIRRLRCSLWRSSTCVSQCDAGLVRPMRSSHSNVSSAHGSLYMQGLKEHHIKASGRPWLVKVVTDLGTRLWVYIESHLLVKDLQGE